MATSLPTVKHSFEHRCPACGWVVGATKRKRATVGRPFEECSRCGAFVTRTPYDEWALMSPRTRAGILCAGGALVVALGLAPATIAGLVTVLSGRPADARFLLVLAGAGLFLSVSAWIAQMARSLLRSRRRMSDPWYKAKLVEFAIQGRRHGIRPTR